MQLRELREYCQRRAWEIAGEYVDQGMRGATDSRPELNRLMADAHKRRFDAVCVWRFDRFARSVSHLLRALETFKTLGIDFVSYSEQMDTSTPAGKMVFTVLGAVAELERSLIVERVRAGLRNARAKGKRLGRPRTVVDAARIARLHAQGRSIRENRRRARVLTQLCPQNPSEWRVSECCNHSRLATAVGVSPKQMINYRVKMVRRRPL
jgi:DNA invertase Pin-like site-specific DNA recombinase